MSNHQLEEKQNSILNKLKSLEERLNNITPPSIITDNQKRIGKVCEEIGLEHELVRVPSPYYTWTLDQRASYLDAFSPEYLLKSIILENTECTNTDTSIPTNSRYYCVIIQYTTKIQSHKIFKFIKNMNSNESAKKFHFTLAQSAESLTGFEYNAVCPIGTTVKIPIIISKHIMDLPRGVPVFLGGGEVDLKLVVDIHSFKEKVESSGNTVFITDVIDTSDNNNNNTENDI
ncbi:hypothetical protein DDB_G0268796 [Dictyostelium discoideum AX4]|uniref:YbaK/aminoacyl-tRNA synthetase-associated domain-containing protein n=1 Tax=Dictyostelium discoideum TaxID=44689 RepID=Q55EP8_DICDI|nr:hypothetical protein DDB_G0268796 [Dictyostelium discoideum AX4]EAL72987.1 hypothetical protein DDB_G0268796 [Dictyostelium discoideum AX4]|eukprot:XP_646972.1 hypothetical protein DDB_G0268796 [Dictyostelium discoideum AX4]